MSSTIPTPQHPHLLVGCDCTRNSQRVWRSARHHTVGHGTKSCTMEVKQNPAAQLWASRRTMKKKAAAVVVVGWTVRASFGHVLEVELSRGLRTLFRRDNGCVMQWTLPAHLFAEDKSRRCTEQRKKPSGVNSGSGCQHAGRGAAQIGRQVASASAGIRLGHSVAGDDIPKASGHPGRQKWAVARARRARAKPRVAHMPCLRTHDTPWHSHLAAAPYLEFTLADPPVLALC